MYCGLITLCVLATSSTAFLTPPPLRQSSELYGIGTFLRNRFRYKKQNYDKSSQDDPFAVCIPGPPSSGVKKHNKSRGWFRKSLFKSLDMEQGEP